MLSRLSKWLSIFQMNESSSYKEKIGLPFVLSINPSVLTKQEEEKHLQKKMLREIIPNLFIGNREFADNYLLENEKKGNEKIDYVVLRCSLHPLPKEIQQKKLEREDLLKTIHPYDSAAQNANQYFTTCFDFIDTAILTGKKVLVHCDDDASYSPVIVSAYLMRKYGLTSHEAMNHVISKQHCIINEKFTEALQEYEDTPSAHKIIRKFLTEHELSYKSGYFKTTHLKAYKKDKNDLDDGIDIGRIILHAQERTLFGGKNRTRILLEKMGIMAKDEDAIICHRNCKSQQIP